jgi:SAM-dependent methyltransferase
LAKALDDPRTTLARRKMLRRKRFLRKVYEQWYELMAAPVPQGEGRVLEIGSGPGFLGERIPGLIASDVLVAPPLDAVLDARSLPFANASLKAILMTNVLHHIPQPAQFLREAARCVRGGGVIAMVEPWRTAWSEFVYRRLHTEPFDPHASEWEFEASGPLSSANGALPWILFERDREIFERDFPEWRLDQVRLMMPVAYLISGGFSCPAFQPGFAFGLWNRLEGLFNPWMRSCAMFALVVLKRQQP